MLKPAPGSVKRMRSGEAAPQNRVVPDRPDRTATGGKEENMTTASKITMARIALIPVFMALFLFSAANPPLRWAALAVFVVASLTDFVDGRLARKYGQVTDLGKFLDPLADKLLVLSAMAIFTEWGLFPAWALMIVLTREFAVTGLRLVAAGKGVVIAAGFSGKFKTFTTMAALCVWIVFHGIPVLDWTVIAVIVLPTLWSGAEYFVKNRAALAPQNAQAADVHTRGKSA